MKDIKIKPQTTTKAVKNAPKSVEHSAKQVAWDIKTVAKDTLVKNVMDKQLDTKHSEQPQKAEVEATEQVENTYYSAVDTVYQKGKSLAENKVKQHRQQVKARIMLILTTYRKPIFQKCRTHQSKRIMHLKRKRAYKRLHPKILQECKTSLTHRLKPKSKP